MSQKKVMQTLRPDGKKGVLMPQGLYDQLSSFILAALKEEEDLTLNILLDKAPKVLVENGDSDIAWYILQVKLDLEARGLIRVITPVYQKRLHTLKITRQGLKKVKSDKAMIEWSEEK